MVKSDETYTEEKPGVKFVKILHYEGVKARLENGIEYLVVHEYIKRIDMEQIFSIITATAERVLFILKRLSIIVFEGTPKTGRYVFTEKGKRIIEDIKG